MEVTRDIRAFTPVFAGYGARNRNPGRRCDLRGERKRTD